MQPDPPQHGYPQNGQAPMAGGPHPPAPSRPPKQKANAVAAMIAGNLALLAAAVFAWFALSNVVLANSPTGIWNGVVLVNVSGGVLSTGVLAVAAWFTLTRSIPGAWTLCVICALYVVAVLAAAPIMWGTPFIDQLRFVFGFKESDDIAIGLATILGTLTAVAAAIAGTVQAPAPTAAPPRR